MEPEAVTDSDRPPGQFIELTDGPVYLELAGPPHGQMVVLVHGFSVPSYIWDPTFSTLAEAGLRALRYDLYGRGRSARPPGPYDADLFDRQLLGLLNALDVTGPVHLVGLSMGGPICATFAQRHPQRVRRLALIDPAGLPQATPLAARLLLAPFLGELFMALLGERKLVSSQARDFYDPRKMPAAYLQAYREQLRVPGTRRALLSTLRAGFLSASQAAYAALGRMGLPTLLIWGRHDRTVPFQLSQRLLELIPQAQFHPIDEAGHLPHYEHPERVNRLLIDFLRR
jgi:pimeloyl-ACP methyl ester carboxylesterase